jgi:hypothetical protein
MHHGRLVPFAAADKPGTLVNIHALPAEKSKVPQFI